MSFLFNPQKLVPTKIKPSIVVLNILLNVKFNYNKANQKHLQISDQPRVLTACLASPEALSSLFSNQILM